MVLLAAACLLLLSWSALADDAGDDPGDDTDTFLDVVDVEIVNIDVWVSDKGGEPVTGLERDDFIVYRDGRPIEIANFYAVAAGAMPDRRLADLPPTPATPEPPGGVEAPPSADDEHRLWLVLYIDNLNIDPIERKRIMPALRQFLGQTLRAGDRAMVVTYDRVLEVRQPFTDNSRLVMASLDEIEDDSGLAVIRNREQVATLKRIDDADNPQRALLIARQYAEQQMNEVGYTTDGLQRLVESLGGLPGRKALVHVSSGIPMQAGEEMFHAVAEKFKDSTPFSEIPRHDTSRDFERLNQVANAHRVVFYTLDAGGLRGMQFGAAEYGGFVTPRLRNVLDSVVPENLQSPLRLMAFETGGRAIVNRNEILPALEEVGRDFASFYSLGISSSGADSGSYHDVEVKLRTKRKGVELRHRAGYRSKNLPTKVQEGLRSAMLYAHEENPLGIQLRLGGETRNESGLYQLPIELKVPLEEVVILPLPDGRHEVRLRLYVGAVGKNGDLSELDSAPMGLILSEEHVAAAKRESLVHAHGLLLSPGRTKIGVAVLDVFGRQASIVTRFVDIGPIETKAGR